MTESELYNKLNASSDLDILEHFPSSYLSLVQTPKDQIYTPLENIILHGRVSEIKSLRAPISIIRFYLVDDDGAKYNVAIYNQPFYSNILRNNKVITAVTNYKEKTKSFILKSIINEDSPYLKSMIKPIYNLPRGVTTSLFLSTIERILLSRNEYIHDLLPLFFKEKYRLETRLQAFIDVHNPSSSEALHRGLRVFKYEEALKYCVFTEVTKRLRASIKKLTTKTVTLVDINPLILSSKFILTGDQALAIKEILADLSSSTSMYRLLQGDVGTGKTLVAMLAVFGNFLRGGQSAILAPTQILATQHFNFAKDFFKSSGLKVALLLSKTKAKARKELLKNLEEGSIDLLIGTSSLLSDKLKYKNLSLVIIDEQQNFGVKQRNALLESGVDTDLLLMTATPIPRTLSRVINADLSVSTLKQFPHSSRQVTSVVLCSTDQRIHKAIRRAMEIKRQVFIVAPKIIETESGNKIAVETIFGEMLREYGEENVSLLHGRMKEEERNKIYADFVSGSKLILVATSIIEVGIDVQRACLMIIYSASCFGLSSLHQLRGRIGRSGEKAMAIFIYDEDDPKSKRTLDFLAANDDGFKIAEYDLQHRGGGSYFGLSQSGRSELSLSNFIHDRAIFDCALSDASYLLDHLEIIEFKSFYLHVLKFFDKYNLD